MLLQVIQMKTPQPPIMFECGVDQQLDGPYLVSSTKDFIWVNRQFPGNLLRAATRQGSINELFMDIVFKCKEMSLQSQWGSCLEYNNTNIQDRLQQVQEYFNYFGFTEFDVYTNETVNDVNSTLVSWVPEKYIVVTPKDKTYLGTVYNFNSNLNGVVVHNPSRGICILYPE